MPYDAPHFAPLQHTHTIKQQELSHFKEKTDDTQQKFTLDPLSSTKFRDEGRRDILVTQTTTHCSTQT